MLSIDQYNQFCGSLAHANYVVQWGGAHVWKVDKKVFAIGGWQESSKELFITFKVTPNDYEILSMQEGCRPAPYLASRGMKWIQRIHDVNICDAEMQEYIRVSHTLASLNLSKKRQKELNLNQ